MYQTSSVTSHVSKQALKINIYVEHLGNVAKQQKTVTC
jgi:hypothetical protein